MDSPVYKNLRSGFTTIEVIMVIAIIGILSAISIPKIGTLLEDIREKVVSERLVEDLNYLRNYAISRHDTTWLVVDAAQNQYGLYVGPTSGTRTLIPDPQTLESIVLDLDVEYEGVSITSASFGGSAEVSFNYWGTPSSGGTIVLDSRTITLVPETGMAHETQ